MTAISALTANYEGTGTANAGSVGATQITGSGTATYDTGDPKEGNSCLQLSGTANQINVRWDFTSVTTFWMVFYMKTPSTAPSAALTIAQWTASDLTTVVGALRLNADMTLSLRDASTAQNWTGGSGTSSPTLPTSSWVRIAIKAIPGSSTGHRCRVYTSNAGNATTPDMDSGNVPCTSAAAANVASWRVGVLTNTTTTFFVDRQRADDSTEPAGLTAGLPPVVSAGPDLTKEVSTGTFTITGTDTPGGGLTIASRAWSILSGTPVTLSGQSTATVTVTAPAATGTTVLRYSVTDSSSQTTTDDVTLTWIAAGQTFYPVADFANTGTFVTQSGATTGLYAVIDDPGAADNSDYIVSVQSPSGALYQPRLTSRAAPTNATGWYLSVTHWVAADVTSSSIVWSLREADGTTVRKTWSAITTATTTPQEFQLTLTSTEINSISSGSWGSGLVLGYSVTAS